MVQNTDMITEVSLKQKSLEMKIVKLIKVYGVMLIKANSLEELYRNTDKDLCKEYKRKNRQKGKMGIMIVDTIRQ